MLVHFIRNAQLHRVRVLVGVFIFLVFVSSFWRKNEPSTISWRVIIDTQNQGKPNDNGPHSMVRSMWLLLELLWQNCCHHPVNTRNLVDVWFCGLSHVTRCPAPRQKRERERETKQVVRIPLDQGLSSSLCTGFYSTGMYLCMIVVIIIVVENGWHPFVCLFQRETTQVCAYSLPATLAHFQQLEHRI